MGVGIGATAGSTFFSELLCCCAAVLKMEHQNKFSNPRRLVFVIISVLMVLFVATHPSVWHKDKDEKDEQGETDVVGEQSPLLAEGDGASKAGEEKEGDAAETAIVGKGVGQGEQADV